MDQTYNPDQFVNREREIEQVKKALTQLRKEPSERAQIIIFRGERGLGKTWLALHLHRKVLKEVNPAPRSFLIHLQPIEEKVAGEDEWRIADHVADQERTRIERGDTAACEAIIKDMVNWLTAKLDITRAPAATLREISSWMAEDIRRKLDNNPELIVSLILDSVFETNHTLIDTLEQYLLAPLLSLPRALIIMTGRGRPYLWKSPYLRLEGREEQLEPFANDNDVKEQIKHILKSNHWPAESEIIQAIIDQISEIINKPPPLTARLLTEALIQKANPEQIADSSIDGAMIAQVSDQLLKGIIDDDNVRHQLETISILNEGFRENEMAILLTDSDKHASPDLAQARRLVDQLLASGLLRWQDKRYVIDEAARAVLEAKLRLNQRERWRTLHQRAAEQYQAWHDKFNHPYYFERAEYHRQQAASSASPGQHAPINPAEETNDRA